MKRIFTAVLIFASLFFTTCEVSLGSRINLLGPVVTVIEPSLSVQGEEVNGDPSVGIMFNLLGTAESITRIARVTVNIDYWNGKALERKGREYKWDGGWYTREGTDSSWEPYNESSYDHISLPITLQPGGSNEILPPSWAVDGDVVTFNLPVLMDRMEKGRDFIKVGAYDAAGKHDSNSMKNVRVYHTNDAPNLRVIVPELKPADGSSLSDPFPPDYSNFIFDPFGDPEGTSNDLRHFTNLIDDLAWDIMAEGSGSTQTFDMQLAITGRGNLDEYPIEDRNNYWYWVTENSPVTRGIHYSGVTGTKQIGGITYTGVGENVVWFSSVDALPKDQVTPMQFVSRVTETGVGHEEYLSKGWLLYLPDSDKPYADISFAKKWRPGTPKPASSEYLSLARGGDTTGIAYDDDGVKSVSWELYDADDDDETVVLDSRTPILTSPNAKRTAWPFRADPSYGPGTFKIKVIVTDTNNLEGDVWYGFFKIESNSTPTLHAYNSGLNTATLWGNDTPNGKGDFTLGGTAQIECSDLCDGTSHNVRVDRVTVVWLRDPNDTQSRLQYSDKDYAEWDSAFNGTAVDSNGNKRTTDSKGNKIWEIKPASITFKSGTEGNGNGNTQEDWNFSLNLNLFSDLDIGIGAGKLPFDGQDFVLRFLSYGISGSNSRLASTTNLSTMGDLVPPSLAIETIYVTKAPVEGQPPNQAQPYTPETLLPTLGNGDKVRIRGTWTENSVGQWRGLGPNRHTDLLGPLSVNWSGEFNTFNFPVPTFDMQTQNDGGIWETAEYTFTALNEDPLVELTVNLTDLAGNVGEAKKSVLVTTNYPTFSRFSSTAADGRYGPNKDVYPAEPGEQKYIEIYMEFNKPVTMPVPGNAPTLTLSNGATVPYMDGNGSNRIYFKYTLAAGDNNDNDLNVTAINWGAADNDPFGFGAGGCKWRGTGNDSLAVVQFPTGGINYMLTQGSQTLASQKDIVIDKTAPTVTDVSATSAAGSYGKDSAIHITVTFDEDIRVGNTVNSTNTYLTFTAVPGARAYFEQATGGKAISFLYTVGAGHDTGSLELTATGLTLGGNGIADLAANLYDAAGFASKAVTGIKIDTTAASAPTINGVDSSTTYYEATKQFTISGLESNDVSVEYHLNYTNGTETGWNRFNGTISNQTATVTLPLPGAYNIAARQIDRAATTPNISPVSAAKTNVKLDPGNIVEQVTSTNPNGYYGAGVSNKSTINITLKFRIPVSISAGSAYVTLNVLGGSNPTDFQANLTGAVTNSKTCSFTFNIQPGVNVNLLNVEGITWGSSNVTDASGTNINSYINATSVGSGLDPENRLSGQKSITILTGNPVVTNRGNLNGDITFTNNGQQLRLKFDREIFRGTVKTEKFVIMQIKDGYRFQAVMSEARWSEIFNNRTDIFSDYTTAKGFTTDFINLTGNPINSAALWRAVGEYLYQLGRNGATLAGGTDANPGASLTSDTTNKYVLRYAVSNTDADTVTITGITGITSVTIAQIKEVFRAAEALTFSPTDPAISIVNGDTLSFALTGSRALPVLGAQYSWSFPKNFVMDYLEKPNVGGSTVAGSRDTYLTSTVANNSNTVLRHSGVEIPVIRVNKEAEDTLSFVGLGDNRQARQQLQSGVKITSRTPNADVTYQMRQTSDNVTQLLMRNSAAVDVGTTTQRLPNLGTQAQNAAGRQSYENTKMRPQSGVTGANTAYRSPYADGTDWAGLGLNYYAAMGNFGAESTTLSITLGDDNYMGGGMEFHIRARARVGTGNYSGYAYEAAYRSVFVFNNSTAAGNETGAAVNVNANGGSARARVWVRGGDSTDGDPTVPDFPIARDGRLARKVRLLTAVQPGTLPTTNFADYRRTEANVLTTAVGTGRQLWIWVTWKINVPAYIDILYGDLPESETVFQAPRTNIGYLYKGWIFCKEHYALFPGRTTIVESRTGGTYQYLWDGERGNIDLTSAASAQYPTDLPPGATW